MIYYYCGDDCTAPWIKDVPPRCLTYDEVSSCTILLSVTFPKNPTYYPPEEGLGIISSTYSSPPTSYAFTNRQAAHDIILDILLWLDMRLFTEWTACAYRICLSTGNRRRRSHRDFTILFYTCFGIRYSPASFTASKGTSTGARKHVHRCPLSC